MISHFFSSPSAQQKLNDCKTTAFHLTNCLSDIINEQFQNLHQQHLATAHENKITLLESNTDIAMPETYQISLFSYPKEITDVKESMQQNHDLLIFFTAEENKSDLHHYLDSLNDYGAALKAHSITLNKQPYTIQILERYYDFDTSTFNDFR